MALIIFLSVCLIIVALLILTCVSGRMTKREIEEYAKEFKARHAEYEKELTKPSEAEAAAFARSFKGRIAVREGIEKELQKRHKARHPEK